MSKISMVMFDLSGTTVFDDTGVRDCLYKAAQEFELKTTPDEILLHMGTNKIHLYQFLIARSQGQDIDFKDFEKIQDPKTYDLAKQVFDRYEEIMIAHYRSNVVKEVPGAADTFRWCHDNGHQGCDGHWVSRSNHRGHHGRFGLGARRAGRLLGARRIVSGERGRPAPFMLFYAMEPAGCSECSRGDKNRRYAGGYARGPKRGMPRRHRCAQRTTAGYGMGEILAHACHS